MDKRCGRQIQSLDTGLVDLKSNIKYTKQGMWVVLFIIFFNASRCLKCHIPKKEIEEKFLIKIIF
jgi:hypothetical protein